VQLVGIQIYNLKHLVCGCLRAPGLKSNLFPVSWNHISICATLCFGI